MMPSPSGTTSTPTTPAGALVWLRRNLFRNAVDTVITVVSAVVAAGSRMIGT